MMIVVTPTSGTAHTCTSASDIGSQASQTFHRGRTKLSRGDLKSITDMSYREVAVFTPLLVLTIWMGVYPMPFLEIIEVSVANLVEQHKTAMLAAEAITLAGQ